jgi:hypothetical protein
MVLTDSFFIAADTTIGDSMIIGATLEYRNGYMSDVMYRLYKDEINRFKVPSDKRGAMLYIGGASEHHSHTRIYPTPTQHGTMPVKAQMGYMASKIAGGMGNIEYLSINANACASGMFAIHEAYDLIHNKGFDEVIIYGEEWVEPNEELLYTQLKIPVIPSDGFVVLKFSRAGHRPFISATSWIWNKEKSPFDFSQEGYELAMRALGNITPDFVKLHGTGTEVNDRAEMGAISAVYGTMYYEQYKPRIGHSQGVSAALELAMVCKDHPYKTIVCNAAGLGNFYGSVCIET